jgi:hypothetical protein
MAEQDPREYRGGVHEPEDAKSGSWANNEGIVPRDMIDEPTDDTSADAQQLGDAVKGEVTDRDPSDSIIDPAGGDEADATAQNTTGSHIDDLSDIEEGKASVWNAANVAPADGGVPSQ